MAVADRSWLCIKVTHEEDLVGRARVTSNPEKNVLDLKAAHIVIDFIDWVMQVSVDEDKVAFRVLDISHLHQSTVAHST